MVLMIAFSGVALASWLAESTPEKQTIKTATKIVVWKPHLSPDFFGFSPYHIYLCS
jgi:hypothetical protein